MKRDIFLQNIDSLNSLMNEGRFAEGMGLCQILLAEIENQNMSEEDDDACKRLYQMNAVLVIEQGHKNLAVEAIDLLDIYADDAYCNFLKSRLYWLLEEQFQALLTLESYYKITAYGDTFVVAEESQLLALDGNMRQRVLNFLGHIYKFFSMPVMAAQCSFLAQEAAGELPVRWQEYSNYLFDLHYLFMSKEDYFQAHAGFNELFKGISQFKHNKENHISHMKIRLGYISSDFRQHVCLLFVWAMLTAYNRECFEVYVFSRSAVEDEYSELIKGRVDGWFNVSGLSIEACARKIYEQEIDILVDLAGHASGNGLPVLAYKPAPVQACGIGYFATTGLQAVDYFLTDKYLVNKDTQRYFVEKLLVLPHSHFCYTPLNDMPSASKGAPCNKKGYITFGSFNNLTKVNDEVLMAWAEILHHVPGSRLLLKGDMLGSPEGCEIIRQKLISLNIKEARFDLRPFTLPYLEQYYEVDIALDTFPYPGGGTTCDALYMGVPVVTLGDGSHGGNFGISLLKNIGLDACCTYSKQEYVERAVMLAADYELLDALHRGLRNMMDKSPILNSDMYIKDLEDGYRKIWSEYVNGK